MSWRRNLWKSVREVRVLAGRSGEGSQGARDFVKFHYRDIKILNPQVPFLVETAGSDATLVAQFDKGVEKQVSIEGLSLLRSRGSWRNWQKWACQWRRCEPTTDAKCCCLKHRQISLLEPNATVYQQILIFFICSLSCTVFFPSKAEMEVSTARGKIRRQNGQRCKRGKGNIASSKRWRGQR